MAGSSIYTAMKQHLALRAAALEKPAASQKVAMNCQIFLLILGLGSKQLPEQLSFEEVAYLRKCSGQRACSFLRLQTSCPLRFVAQYHSSNAVH